MNQLFAGEKGLSGENVGLKVEADFMQRRVRVPSSRHLAVNNG